MSGPYQVGDVLAGRYEVAEIHRGGMSLVYVARDLKARPARVLYALKTLRDEFGTCAVRRGRFTAECHVWTGLGVHPHIVTAYETIEVENRSFVVLEYINGGDLRRWIGKPKLDVPCALRFGVQFCLGLEEAQRGGMESHRDIKPANLLTTSDGNLKITDFGLVRLRDEILLAGLGPRDAAIPLVEPHAPQPIIWMGRDRLPGQPAPDLFGIQPPGSPRPAEDASRARETGSDGEHAIIPLADLGPGLPIDRRFATTIDLPRDEPEEPEHELTANLPDWTRTGLMLGTLPYMAPEQFHSPGDVDVRADLYAFGIVLFEMLAGRRPFLGPTVARIRRQHERYDPPSLVPVIPRKYRRHAEAIDEVVARCLRKSPRDRYVSAVELRRALTRVLKRIDPSFDPMA